jgi:integrase
MPYTSSDRPGPGNFYKTRFRYNGIAITAGCGTTNLRTARAMEEMIRKLKRDRQHVILTALVEKKIKLTQAYVLYEDGKLTPESVTAIIEEQKKPEPIDLVLLLDRWATGIKNMHNGTMPETEAKYERQIRTFLGRQYFVAQFTPSRISTYLHGRQLKGASRNKIHTALSVFADYLVEVGELETNPLRQVKRFKEDDPREIWLDNYADAKRLVMALPMPHRAAVALSLATGMERQAIWRLRRRMVTFGAKPEAHARGGKNKWRNRIVRPTDMWMWQIFANYARHFLPDVLMFNDINPDTTLTKIAEALKETGIDQLEHAPETLHDMRHVYAVFGLKDGLPLHLVARQLGHRDTSLAQKVYGRHEPSADDYAVYLSRSALANPHIEQVSESSSA